MVDLLEMIFQIQKPTWVDCKQFFFMFFNTEELMRIVTEAWKWLQTQAPAGILDTDRWAREAFPDEEPDWNPNSEDGMVGLERYWLAFLQEVRAGAKKPTNMAKISEVFQETDESPAAFYVRLCEAYRIYTPFKPEAPENQTMVNATFVGQAQPDIRRKLQKLEGFAGKNATELLDIENKVFINQDSAARKEEEKSIQRRANIIAAAFRGSGSQTDQKGKQEYKTRGKRKSKPEMRPLGPHELMVRMKIGGQTMDFMVDTRAEHSVVTRKVAPLSGKEVTIIGATGDQTRRPFCRPH
ncbi:hypothetical protein QTO34_000718 [Cnephaeus nilssonii]|uniref:Core shell protein Gag P30 domain-containing protein n=1 Tax=Cnephaeus nilssonii TaxID=3371016 RepID=A0AA40LWV0_CNENI|nr:hypothetical protein QTO34_000718 [Eptesicus nilssonii]